MNKILFVLLSLLTSLQSYSQEQNEKKFHFSCWEIYTMIYWKITIWNGYPPNRMICAKLPKNIQYSRKYMAGILPDNQRASSKTPAVNKSRSANGGLIRRIGRFSTKAIQMANSAFKAVNKMNLKVPFIMTKGNHDITGPGAKEALKSILTQYGKVGRTSILTVSQLHYYS